MSFELLHFRGSDKILKKKRIEKDVQSTMAYIHDALSGALYKRELFRQALSEMGWVSENGDMVILEGRRYRWKGFKKGIAIEGNVSGAYEYLLEGAFRLQLGYDKGLIETGILILNAKRSDKSPYGSTSDMLKEDIEFLSPTISLPLTVCLFDLEEPGLPDAETNPPDGE